MKIGFLIQSMASGGAERATAALANEMNKKGQIVEIITFNGYDSFYTLNEGVRHVNMDLIPLRSSPLQKIKDCIDRMFTIRKEIKSRDLDVIVCMNSVIAGYGVFSTAFTKTKTVGAERNNPYKYFSGRILSIVKRICAFLSDGYIFQTKAASEYFLPSVQKKGAVIPNAVFNPLVNEIEPTDQKQKIIYSVGRFVKEKRFDCLIDAFDIVSRKHPDYKLIIFGEGKLRDELEHRIDVLSLTDKVLLPGNNPEALRFISKGSVYVLCSEFEGMPNALMEAMAVGVPCVSARCQMGPEELIENGENGLLVSDCCSPEELADGILKVIENPELSQTLSSNSIKIKETHSLSNITDQWIDYLQSIRKYKAI